MDYQLDELSLELTNNCAGKCLHCSSEAGCKKEDELNLTAWGNCICQAKKMGAKIISLSGGDPLVYYHWRLLVGCIVYQGLDCLFYTCGFSYDAQSKLRPISNHDLHFLADSFHGTSTNSKLIFSLEGATRETHGTMFGYPEAFNVLTEQIIPRAITYGIPVELHFTPTAINIHEVTAFLDLAEKLDVEKVSFLRLVPQGRAELNREQLMLDPRQFHELQKTLYEYKGGVEFRIGCPLSFGHLYGYVEKRPFCHAGKDVLLVRPDGDVHCCAGWKNCKLMVLGNVLERSLKEIWEDSVVLKMIRDFNDNNNAKGYCDDCSWVGLCGGGCPAQRIILNQFIGYKSIEDQFCKSVDPMCPRFNGFVSDEEIGKIIQDRVMQDSKGNIDRRV